MKSLGNEDNFQNNSTENMEVYAGEKTRGKFSVFRKTGFYGKIFIPNYSPLLDESKNIYFDHDSLTWRDTGVQNVPVIDDISVTVKYGEFLRNISSLFS